MTKLDKALERYACNAEYERAHGNLQGCLEFKQLCKWLKELRAYREMYRKEKAFDLDQIRVEVGSLSNANPSYWHSGDMVDRDDVLEIIDKYRAGGEDQ